MENQESFKKKRQYTISEEEKKKRAERSKLAREVRKKNLELKRHENEKIIEKAQQLVKNEALKSDEEDVCDDEPINYDEFEKLGEFENVKQVNHHKNNYQRKSVKYDDEIGNTLKELKIMIGNLYELKKQKYIQKMKNLEEEKKQKLIEQQIQEEVNKRILTRQPALPAQSSSSSTIQKQSSSVVDDYLKSLYS